MTFLRNDPDNISNYFNALFDGLGPRHSSYANVDGLAHDGHTHNIRLMEFKHPWESIDKAVVRTLRDASKCQIIQSWAIWLPQEQGGKYLLRRYESGGEEEELTADELKAAYDWRTGLRL